MELDTRNSKPIYVEIAYWLETEILSGNFGVDEKIYSQYQLAEIFNINPATAAKGLNLLVDDGILYKKRGLGMFVSAESMQKIYNKRKNKVLKNMISDILREADNLGVSDNELIKMIKSSSNERG